MPNPTHGADRKERLHSWKEIADYLGRGVRTVQRWEREEGLPVHRQAHLKAPTIFALTAELDAWLEQRVELLAKPEMTENKPPASKVRLWQLAAGALLMVVGGGIAWRAAHTESSPHSPFRLTRVTSYPKAEQYPAFSPDGSRLAFTWDGEQAGGSIYVKLFGLEKMVRVTNGQGTQPAWSPDGQWIAFHRTTGGGHGQIVRVSALGGSEHVVGEILNAQVILPKPYVVFTPDGKRLVVADASGNRGPYTALVLMPVEGGTRQTLTVPPPGMSDTAPAISPDGRTLAFSRGDYRDSHVYLLRLTPEVAAQGEAWQLTHDKFPVGNPVWTADGREIIYGTREDDPAGLFRITADGSQPSRLIPGTGMAARHLAISRQGDRLAFSNYTADDDIWRLPLQKPQANPETAFISSSRSDRHPRYSPDGTRIAFLSNRSGAEELWVCRHNGSDPIQLSFMGARVSGQPNWSPDGKMIAFASSPQGAGDIYLVPAGGGKPRQLTNHPGHDQSPVWSPDGKWIFFCSERGGEFQVWKMSADGGPPSRITRNGGPQLQLSPDGKVVYYVGGWGRFHLWSASAEGGGEKEILDPILTTGAFTAARDGIFYYRLDAQQNVALFLYRYATGKSELVRVAASAMRHASSLAVSPDGQFLLVTLRYSLSPGDIMMLENFR